MGRAIKEAGGRTSKQANDCRAKLEARLLRKR